MNSFIMFVSVIVITILLPASIAGLAVTGARCGTKVCDPLQYCSNYTKHCDSCANICENSSHNLDLHLCADVCQDYLHETRYIKAANYAADIQKLQKQQTIILIILIVLLIMFVGIHGCQCIRWLRRKDYLSFEYLKRFRASTRREKQQPAPQSDFTHANPHTQSPQQMRKNNGARSVFSISGNESTVQTVSTPISRHPAEDNLDYTYDNVALQMTPGDKPKTETNF
ncbi:protein grindelwald [Bradysia coprophila]|uniref:protein grindelwald n=1 Tax=Bradysia coprophila TaxID=38358 RepID=UPI00187D9207|nr:protein grindelwald [Bradysia coprophila]